MKTMDFTEISSRYEQDSLVQKSAAEKLISLLDLQRHDDVLDLGCGAGNLTRKLRSLTDGRVAGVDPSRGMILEAEAKRNGLDISFDLQSVHTMQYQDNFSAIFCNSAFQWFRDPPRALYKCFQALRRNGRMGIQAPATMEYCPNFLAAIAAVASDPRTSSTFAGFQPPWLFLDTAEEYAALFRQAGFSVPFAKIESISTPHPPEEVMAIFESGAAAGYLNQEHYSIQLDEAYCAAFREIVKQSFFNQANDTGNVALIFNRIYLIAVT